MKYLFFLVLLGNIVFFLWEINSGVETNDSQRETYISDKEKLILLLSEIDLGQVTEKISTKIQNVLTDEQENNGITNSGQQPLSKREQGDPVSAMELIQKEDVTELPDTEQLESIIIEDPSDNPGAGQQVNLEDEPIEISSIELENDSEGTVDVALLENLEVSIAVEKEQQLETENPIVQFFTQKAGVTSEQDSKQFSCYEMGPFTDKEALQQWQNQLEEEIVFLAIQSRDIEEIKDYMIIYPAAESYEKSKEKARKFRELGIKDIWLFEKGDNRGAISLGLFESKLSADKAQEQYKQDGLSVQIKPRFRDVLRYFSSMELDEKQHEKIIQLASEMEKKELSSCA